MLKFVYFSSKDKVWVGPIGILAFVILYMTPNHIHFFDQKYLHMFKIEKSIPFLAWNVWIYLSDYLYIAVVFTLLKDRENMNRIYYSQIMMLIFSMMVFVLYPTMYPRP